MECILTVNLWQKYTTATLNIFESFNGCIISRFSNMLSIC